MKTPTKMTMNTKKLTMFRLIGCCFLLCVVIASANTAVAAATTATKTGENFNKPKEDCTDLARDEETLMVFSTLGGGLTAIDPITSEIRWTIPDDPPVMAEQQQNVHVPQYLPDPRDGSIYQLGDMGSLKKLPYTIPQLVASAPCRSSDGILYSGKKSDTWFAVDPKSGRRQKVMGFGENDGGGSGTQSDAESVEIDDDDDNDGEGEEEVNNTKWGKIRPIFLGRTQYTVMMYDSLTKDKNVKPCNITFYDYSAHSMTPDITKEYEYLHLTTTSNGNIVTLDRKNGKFLWKRDLTSPVVASFLLGSEGLLSVPFTTVSDEAFESILEESKFGNVNTVKLFKSLYVGEHRHGLYALPSLVDKNTPRISTAPPIKLLDGPHTTSDEDPRLIYLNDVMKKRTGIVLGHYNVPIDDGKLQISPPTTEGPTRTPTNKKDLAPRHEFSEGYTTLMGNAKNTADIGVQVEVTLEATNAFNKTKKIILANSNKIQAFINEWFMDHPSGKVHQILIILVLAMVTMFWYMCSTMRELKNQSENGSKTYGSSGSNSSGVGGAPAEDLVDLGNGQVRVGKISFNCNEVLGKGCEGTFVFKGTFEERFVAVKRLLPECFTFADREVALLRESDAHENVVRYFCTEQDRQFRYIAVELCAATLQDYTEGERSMQLKQQIDVWEVLRQAAAGLSHLHTLNIVHRDIKPQNVLLSQPDANGQVRVMISDFGLCKKLNFGKTSFSRRSGVTGTDGWIAPEMMRGLRTTTAVDIFSLGCVYYYVLSDGHHAFGDALKRQVNILTHDYNLSKLDGLKDSPSKYILAEQLIADMINKDAQKRPPASSVGQHPIFWNNQKILAFLQDVSDRVEKLQFHAEPLKSLEKNGDIVVLQDWNLHLDPLITEDLRKYRGYMGASVRDLLRALRNKKHHYHELTEEVQSLLGCIPQEFTNYWISKFPQLIQHAYHALSICSHEPIFRTYYNTEYRFSRPEYFEADDDLYPSLLRDPKPLPKQNNGGGSPATPSKRKGSYNFRKSPAGGDAEVLGVGLQRNVDFNMDDNTVGGGGAAGQTSDVGAGNKRDAYANFKFRRYQKSSNRNYNNFSNNKDKHVVWTLPPAEQKDNTSEQ